MLLYGAFVVYRSHKELYDTRQHSRTHFTNGRGSVPTFSPERDPHLNAHSHTHGKTNLGFSAFDIKIGEAKPTF